MIPLLFALGCSEKSENVPDSGLVEAGLGDARELVDGGSDAAARDAAEVPACVPLCRAGEVVCVTKAGEPCPWREVHCAGSYEPSCYEEREAGWTICRNAAGGPVSPVRCF